LVWILAVMVVVLLIAGGLAIIVVGAKGYYALVPGSAPLLTESSLCRGNGSRARLVLPNGTPCVGISVPPGRGRAIYGSIFMVNVLVGPATPFQYVLRKVGLLHRLDQGAQLVPAKAVLGTTPAGQLSCQAAQQMAGSTASSAVVALRHLGYPATKNDLGAQLYEVTPGSPAAAAGLHCNDVVVAVNGAPIRTSTDLGNAIRAGAPGEAVRITVQRTGPDRTLRTQTLAARLETAPAAAGPALGNEPFLGVASMTRTTYTLPFDINVDVGDIGGPSAGLALTLAILDILSGGDLTGGHAVAATGTMELDGSVGDVGGVAQKAVAVRRAGVKVFFVPADQLRDAQSEAGTMKLYPVKTLQQALDDLQALGGHVPPPSSAPDGAP
jgi:PDZ domain-containing protein